MSPKRWTDLFSAMPIKLKLTLGLSLLLAILLIGFNSLQYILLEKWIHYREQSAAERSMNDILNYFLERETGFTSAELPNIRHYLDKVNQEDERIRILDGDGQVILTVTSDVPEELVGTSYLIVSSPLTIFEFQGTVEIVRNMVELEQLTDAISQVMFLCGIGAIGISMLVGWLLSRRLLKPLQGMAETIRNVKSKGLQERMNPPVSGDELATLMTLFNEIMDQVEASFRQQSRFGEDASHELRTPVAIIEGHLSLLQRWGKEHPAVIDEALTASREEFARLKGLVLELLALTKAETAVLDEEVLLHEPGHKIRGITAAAGLIYPAFTVETDVDALSGVSLRISSGHLEQIMLTLIDNAVKYSLESRIIHIRTRLQEELACIAISDNGMGIPANDLPHVMERFYRVDKARGRDLGGNGLGLAIAKQLIERYQGTLTIQSEEHKGTTVTLAVRYVRSHAGVDGKFR